MAELYGVDLNAHLQSIVNEYETTKTIYGYPERKIYRGFPGIDLAVDFHGRKATTALGPASGPHTQMVQNILLSFLGGARIMELKTVQIMDQLEIPRPCIDVRNIGFNVEWSQELRLEDSYYEYVAAWIILKIIEEMEFLGIARGNSFYDTIFDISVGYDLKGISSPQIHKWLCGMKNAATTIRTMLDTLSGPFAQYKDLEIDPHICNSVTLSTFHGCPRDEIEAIVKHLVEEHRFHTIVKMNPTILGYERVSEILHNDLGYTHIELDPEAFENDLQFTQGVEMIQRLEQFAAKFNCNIGAKFTNTLVVKNNEEIFSDKVMYLSGVPLHVISMNAMNEFRNAVGKHLHISFSAGIDKHNFPDAVLCNMRPITTCTDLLKTGGYTRLYDYLKNLHKIMTDKGYSTLQQFICGGRDDLVSAGVDNAATIVANLVKNPRYHYQNNRKAPPKIDSQLKLFDCITCNKCLPVCPNTANFSFPTIETDVRMLHLRYQQGQLVAFTEGNWVLHKKRQIANLADFCNECGNCDTYCPEHGGPFIEKPRFFSFQESYNHHDDYDGFYFTSLDSITGRMNKIEYTLTFDPNNNEYLWQSPQVEVIMSAENKMVSGKTLVDLQEQEVIDMTPYYSMKTILDGMRAEPDNYSFKILNNTAGPHAIPLKKSN